MFVISITLRQTKLFSLISSFKLYNYEKETIFVVTVTYLDLKDFSLNTFVEGYSKELSGAKAILDRDRQKKIEIGYIPEHFETGSWEWTYKHKYGNIHAEIHLVRE